MTENIVDQSAQQREAELTQRRERNQVLLKDFILSKGGKITFQEFMWFNSFSEHGYYPENVKIGVGPDYDFDTYASNPLLAQAYVGCAEKHLIAPESYFVEIAGGEGTLKKNGLRYLRECGIPAKYVSIDMSLLLIGKQKAIDPLAIQATALQLPFADNSINGAIVANELPDALPLSVVAVRTSNTMGLRKMLSMEELSYKLQEDGTIVQEWNEITTETREVLEIIQEAWAERGIFLDNCYDGQKIVFAPGAIRLITELIRVLRSGQIILSDYGTHIDEITGRNGITLFDRLAVRQFPRKNEVPLKDLPNVVFENDLTCDVDFTLLVYIAKKLGATCRLYDQSEFCARFNPDELFESVSENPADTRAEWFNSRNPIKSGPGWKVLVITVNKEETVLQLESAQHTRSPDKSLSAVLRNMFNH